MYITLEEDKPMDKEEVKPTGSSRQTEIAEPGFTPGEWRVVGGELRYTNEGDLYAIIQTPVAAIDIIAPKVMADQHIANARLIAAAPALHEALMKIANDPHNAYESNEGGSYGIGVTDGHRCAAQKARAALALVDNPKPKENDMNNERIEIEDDQRCGECGSTEGGSCFNCKDGLG